MQLNDFRTHVRGEAAGPAPLRRGRVDGKLATRATSALHKALSYGAAHGSIAELQRLELETEPPALAA